MFVVEMRDTDPKATLTHKWFAIWETEDVVSAGQYLRYRVCSEDRPGVEYRMVYRKK